MFIHDKYNLRVDQSKLPHTGANTNPPLVLTQVVYRLAVVRASSGRRDRQQSRDRALAEPGDRRKEKKRGGTLKRRRIRSHRVTTAKKTALLTESSLESVGSVLADAIPAVQIERTDAVGMKLV